MIPLAELSIRAQENLRSVQEKIKKGLIPTDMGNISHRCIDCKNFAEKQPDLEFSLQDFLLVELLGWFKGDFFTWVDAPPCAKCQGVTQLSHMSSDPNDLVYTGRVEVYKCSSCPDLTKFPRYNDLNILLETRRGRCGEWARVFTLLCLALGWDARYVVDELDHVWTEVDSNDRVNLLI